MDTQFQLPALKFSFDALEPVIDARTMEIHHDKHHAAYVTNLNKALESAPELYKKPVEEILRDINKVPESIRTAVRNNGGGHANHTLFWEILNPGGARQPSGALKAELEKTFTSFDGFMENSAVQQLRDLGQDGHGWWWMATSSFRFTPLPIRIAR